MKSSSANIKDPCGDGQHSFQAIRIVLFDSFDPCLFPRKGDARLTGEHQEILLMITRRCIPALKPVKIVAINGLNHLGK